MAYRLSRRGQDFLIENSEDGKQFRQMRIFHMHEPIEAAHIGVYACSPLDSSIQAVFSDFELGECVWELYENPD
jgi:regulation of enolase protein 1 (concanavalin A-like superfamily)